MTKAATAAASKPPPDDDDGIESTTAEQLRKLYDMSDIIFLIDGYTFMWIAPSFLRPPKVVSNRTRPNDVKLHEKCRQI